MRVRLCAWMVAALLAIPLGAQVPTMNDRAFAEAAVVVMGYDLFADRCTSGNAFTASESAAVTTWQRDNGADLVRAHITVLERDADTRQKLAQTRTAFAQRFTSVQGRTACQAAMALIAQPDAQLSRKSPELLRALRAQGTAPAVAVAGAAPVAGQPPAPRRAGATVDPALLRSINAFGFDTRAEMGMGGFIGIKVYPVVLFRDGSALTDIAGLAFAGGVDAHRRAHADDWVRWRTQGGEIQLLKDGKWDKLEFQKTYSTLPRDFRLNGRFRRSSGTGNIAVGGTQSVTVVSTYLFSSDGRVVRDVAVGSTASAGDIAVATSQAGPDRRGRYSIDGITLLIRYDDGSEERRLLVTDPADPKSVIWLDGDSYVRR
jgi:hypothetical protein